LTIKDVPFADFVGIKEDDKNVYLDFGDMVQNHIKSIHASAQFTLAETKSGLHLVSLFPSLEGKVIPLLRGAQMKYKKPALEKIIAYASVEEESLQKFNAMFEKKGRGSIVVKVQVKDIHDVLCSEGEFNWFIQAI